MKKPSKDATNISARLSPMAYETVKNIPYGLRSKIISTLLEEWVTSGGLRILVELAEEQKRTPQMRRKLLEEMLEGEFKRLAEERTKHKQEEEGQLAAG